MSFIFLDFNVGFLLFFSFFIRNFNKIEKFLLHFVSYVDSNVRKQNFEYRILNFLTVLFEKQFLSNGSTQFICVKAKEFSRFKFLKSFYSALRGIQIFSTCGEIFFKSLIFENVCTFYHEFVVFEFSNCKMSRMLICRNNCHLFFFFFLNRINYQNN